MKVPFFEGELIRRGTLVFLATLFASIITFLANLAISDILGPKSFGDFRTIIYLFAFIPMLVDLGINASLTKYIAEFGEGRIREVRHLVKWFLGIKLLSFVIIISITFLFRDFIAIYFLKDTSLNYLIPAGIFLLAMTFFSVFNFIILGFQNFKLFSLSQFLSSVSAALLAILLSPFGIFYMILGWGFGPLIANILNIYSLLKRKIFSSSIPTDVKKIFRKFSLPVYPVELSTNLFNAIIPLLSLFFSQILVGYYSFAFMFYLAALLIPNALSTVIFPKVSELNGLKNYDHAKSILRKAFTYYTPVVIVGLVFVFLFSEQFVSLVAKQYLPSLLMFEVLISLGLVFGYVLIYANYLKGLGRVKRYALITLTQNLILIIASFILVTIK
jgi:O-antigen/teichoic acid export membrane protein